MRFKKNKKLFLKVCLKCKKQFQDEKTYDQHIKFCGSMSFEMPKKVIPETNSVNLEEIKQYDSIDTDVIDDFADIESITKDDELRKEFNSKIEDANIEENKSIENIKNGAEEKVQEDEDEDEEDKEEIDIASMIPPEPKKVTRGRPARKGRTKRPSTKTSDSKK